MPTAFVVRERVPSFRFDFLVAVGTLRGMTRNRKLVLGLAALLAAAGGGAAIAAAESGSPSEENQAVLDDAAKQLGISPSKLSDALKKALADRIDAAVAAGRLT